MTKTKLPALLKTACLASVVAATLAAVIAPPGVLSAAEPKVKHTNPTCRQAHAVLAESRSGDHARIWRDIDRTMAHGRGRFKVVDSLRAGTVGEVKPQQWTGRFAPQVTGYIVHCSHGGTCNQLADEFAAAFPAYGSIEVVCGAPPHVYESPQAPSR